MDYVRIVLLSFSLTLAWPALSQLDTDNNYSGDWGDAGSWDEGSTSTTPTTNASGEVNNQADFDIYGYITESGDLTFANIGNNSYEITVRDTLVVGGNLTFQNNAISLTVAAGGLLVVFGNYSSANKVDVNNGGIMVVKGDMTMTGGNADYTGGGGSGLYVGGTVSGNASGDAQAVDEPLENLNGTGDDDEQSLYNFIQQSNPETPLPVELVYFEGSADGSTTFLAWQTASEFNTSHFEILHSNGMSDFQVIGKADASGFTNDLQNYSFQHRSPAEGLNFYQLRSVDFDGFTELFDVIAVEFHASRISMFPNPSNGTSIDFGSLKDMESPLLSVFDINGTLIYARVISDSHVDFDERLPQGVYIIRLQDDFRSFRGRLIVQSR